MKKVYNLFLIGSCLFLAQTLSGQDRCDNAVSLGTPSSTSNCTTLAEATANHGNGSCSGSGFGGSGSFWYVEFTTNANNDCVVLDIAGTTASNVEVILYDGGCSASGSFPLGFVNGSCTSLGDGSAAYSTTDTDPSPALVTTANTTYIAKIWVKNGGNTELCSYTQAPPNDECAGALAIDGIPQIDDNFCATEGTTDPAAGELCAGTLENTAWYTFTVQNTADVIVTIDNIICSGGGAGFQIGYFVGSCGSLTNIGCSTGSGGTVATTITGVTAGQVITIGIDGNAGANCNFDISATNTIPLPIQLTNFSAKYIKEKGAVDLIWVTETEINNDFFTIERSKEGQIFEVVGIINGAGNSSANLNYDLEDETPYKDLSYYRLKQTDFDGGYEYSDVIAVNIESNFGEIGIFPNPILNNSFLAFNSNLNGTAEIIVYDATGRKVIAKAYNVQEGNNKFNLPTAELSKGMYFLRISGGNEFQNIKFIKE
ncbi:MAG: T9SS type A sorting domain-containing protein [Flavobacteriales bacterium]|nr:T9SS type A sorting domain-containing protein [Flavobacteriales bacterium]